ncbi:hypothetical protein [Arthrobacter flavus]|uniref:Asparagine synthetase domain-containing protein n=1 Tax=Arthrobacter flavus TaxID=95172 RepID=A0ABW4QB44_9MICC
MVEYATHEPAVEFIPSDVSSIDTQPDFSHLRFSRGYVLHAPGLNPDVPTFWKTRPFAGRTFRWDPRVGVSVVSDGENEILLCGHSLDPTLETTDLGLISKNLHLALRESRRKYLNALEELFGQYVVLDYHQGILRAQTDAIASRAIFHDTEAAIIASHVNLVGKTLEREPSIYVKWVGRPTSLDFPGRTTEFDGVWLLTPNTELTLGSGLVRRVGPLPYEPLTVAQAADQMMPILEKQVKVLKESGREILVSASAGVDSRTSLAAFARPNVDDAVRTFTYTKAPNSGRQSAELNRDKLAATMSADLLLSHQMFDLNTAEQPPADYVTMLGELSSRRSNTVISWVYHSHLPHNALHIRGQINGVGKWHFAQRLHFAESMEISPRRMASLTKRGKDVKRPLTDPWWTLGERGFREYIKTTKLRSAPAGYRMTDLFLWEHRVANWNHAHIVESDVTFDTYQLFGSRKMIRLMLSVPEIDRAQLSLFREIIGRMEPSLLDYPLNGQPWDPPTYELPLSSYQQGAAVTAAEQSSLRQRLAAANGTLRWRKEEIARLRSELASANAEKEDLRSILENLRG